jgi:hypothetical protein
MSSVASESVGAGPAKFGLRLIFLVLALCSSSLAVASDDYAEAPPPEHQAESPAESVEVTANGGLERVVSARRHDHGASQDAAADPSLSIMRRELGAAPGAAGASQALIEPSLMQPLLEAVSPGPGAAAGGVGRASMAAGILLPPAAQSMAVDAVTPVPAPAGSTGTAPTPAPDAVASNGMTEELQKVLEADGTLLGEHAYSHLRMKSLFIFFGCCFLGANLAVLLWAVPACRRKVDEYTQGRLSFVKNLKMTAAIVLVLLVVFVVIEHWRLSSTSSKFGEFNGKIVNSYVGQLSAKTMVEAPNLHASPASPWSQTVKNPFTYGVSITTMDIKVYAENEKFGDTTLQASVAIGPEEEKQFDTHLTLLDGPQAAHELSKILAGGVTGEGVGALSFDIDMAGSVSGSDFTATMNIDVPFKANGSPVAGNAVAVCDSMVKGIQLLHDKELTLMDYNRLVTSGALAVHTKLMTFMYCIILIPLSTWFAVSAWASQGEKGASAEGPATTSAPTDATLATPAPAAADASSAPPATGDKDSDNEF